jgi:hypothetical protein
MTKFTKLFDEIEYHVQNIDTLAKQSGKEALKHLMDSDEKCSSFKETYQLGFNPVHLRRSGDLLLGFRLLGDSPEVITVWIGGTEYDLTLHPNKFEYVLSTDVVPVVALYYHDIYLQLKERQKTVYIECFSALLHTPYRSVIAKSDWRLETSIEKNRDFAVCTSGMFGIVVHNLKVEDKKCKEFKILKNMTWSELDVMYIHQEKTQKKLYVDSLSTWNTKESKNQRISYLDILKSWIFIGHSHQKD